MAWKTKNRLRFASVHLVSFCSHFSSDSLFFALVESISTPSFSAAFIFMDYSKSVYTRTTHSRRMCIAQQIVDSSMPSLRNNNEVVSFIVSLNWQRLSFFYLTRLPQIKKKEKNEREKKTKQMNNFVHIQLLRGCFISIPSCAASVYG